MKSTEPPETVDVLAIGAHPDDVELHAGGTLLRLASLGYTTGIVDLTRGEAATRGTVAERAAEALAAAAVLGVACRELLDLGDSRLIDAEATRAAVVALLRRLRPRVVLTHHADQPHPDHAAAASLVTAAAYLAGLKRFGPDDRLPPHRPAAVLHFGLPRSTPPSFVVDVSSFEEAWHDSRRAEAETAVSQPDFLARVIARRRGDGAAIGAAAGEAFWVRRCLPVDDPVALFDRPYDVLP
jgi:bacillithiol biosynthesis deacetylase BshB1